MKNILRKTVCLLLAMLLLLPALPVSASTQEYTVTFRLTGLDEKETVSKMSFKVGETIKYPHYDSNQTQSFSGWTLEDGSSVPETMPSEDLTVVATLTYVIYTVSYTLQNGPWKSTEQTYHYGDTLQPPEVPLATGEKFSGWSSLDGEAPDVVTADLSLFGTVSKEEYTLTYILDGKELTDKTQTYYYDDTIEYLDDYNNIEGHSFSGWLLADGSKAPAKMPAENLTVYGSTSKNQYTVTYILNGEQLETVQTYYYGEQIIPLTSFNNVPGFTFSGWKTAEEAECPTVMPAHNITLYGEQTANTYSVLYYLNGQYITTEYYTYGEVISYIADYDNVAGETFSGWKLLAGDTPPETMPAYSISVYGTLTKQAKVNVFGGTYEKILQGESVDVLVTVDAPYLHSLVLDFEYDKEVFMLTDMQWLYEGGNRTVDMENCIATLQSDRNINLGENAVLKLSFTVNSAAKVGISEITFTAVAASLTEVGSKQIPTVVHAAQVQVICGVHDFTGDVKQLFNGTHSIACKNNCGETINETCFGGTATCEKKAICTVCNCEYGFKKAHDYTGAARKNNDGTHSYQCVNGCEQYSDTKYPCTFGFAFSDNNNETHLTTCTICAYEKHENCYGDNATCLQKGTCDACKAPFGEPKAHVYEGNAKSVDKGRHVRQCINGCEQYGNESDCTFSYTPDFDEKHIKTCTLCNYEIAEYCSGGKASCMSKPVCGYCGSEYGSKTIHSYTGETVCNENGSHKRRCINGCDAFGTNEACVYDTCVSAGNGIYHFLVCSICGYKKTEGCSGGKATCSTPAICESCGETYGNKAKHSFTGDYVYNEDGTHSRLCEFRCGAKDAAESCDMSTWKPAGDSTHARSCAVCKHEETEQCHGGDAATCDKLSVCASCNAPYGTKPAHTFDAICEPNKDGTHNRFCTVCKQTIKEDCTSEKPASCSQLALCKFCGEEFGTLAEHTYQYTVNKNQPDTHDVLCTACGYTQEALDCFGGTASCTTLAKCEGCGREYGETADHKYDGTAAPAGNGKHKHLCTMGCGEYGEAVDCTLDQYISNNDNTHTGTCTVCKQKQTLPCSGGKEICGEASVCAYCNATYGNYQSHNFEMKYDGVHHWGDCKYCETITPYEPHNYTAWTVITAVSYKEDGAQWRMCTTCGKINSVTVHLLGDIDNSGDLSAADARLALRASVKLTQLNETQTENADIDGDGAVLAADARNILRACVGIDTNKMLRYTAVEN